jgi:hypothetical protein
MYVLTEKVNTLYGKWYTFTSRVLLRTNLYMTQEVFVDDVFVTTQEAVASNVISQTKGAVVKLNAIAKIYK